MIKQQSLCTLSLPLPAIHSARVVLVFRQKVSYINYIALGYIPVGLTTANQQQVNGSKWQEHNDPHVSDHLHTTGSNKGFASRPEQKGIVSCEVKDINHLLYITTAFLYFLHGNALVA